MQSPSVSVIIPAYNAAKTVWKCVSSALAAESDGAREVIVVDDASTDDTAAIAEALDCRLIRMAANGGPALARNAGVRAARGETLIFIDADTEMTPHSIREALRALEEDGVGAVTGTYEPEPLNSGFFPAYYAYLKYYTFTRAPVRRIRAFGAQCGAVRKEIFEATGGYQPIAWGVDIENDEFGRRLNRRTTVALSPDFRVRHHFADLRKLIHIFTKRVYWWVLFRHQTGEDETVLMTRGFGAATASLPAAAVCLLAAVSLWVLPWSGTSDAGVGRYGLLAVLATVGAAAFTGGYAGFWRFCAARRGFSFAAAAAIASALFSFVITGSAAVALMTIGWRALRRRPAPFALDTTGAA